MSDLFLVSGHGELHLAVRVETLPSRNVWKKAAWQSPASTRPSSSPRPRVCWPPRSRSAVAG